MSRARAEAIDVVAAHLHYQWTVDKKNEIIRATYSLGSHAQGVFRKYEHWVEARDAKGRAYARFDEIHIESAFLAQDSLFYRRNCEGCIEANVVILDYRNLPGWNKAEYAREAAHVVDAVVAHRSLDVTTIAREVRGSWKRFNAHLHRMDDDGHFVLDAKFDSKFADLPKLEKQRFFDQVTVALRALKMKAAEITSDID